jgi:hypothetical protein
MLIRFPIAALAACLALPSCSKGPEPAPDPQALEQFITRLEAQDRVARAAAVAEARRKEQARVEAAEKRLERYRTSAERVLPAPATAEGAVRALAGGSAG